MRVFVGMETSGVVRRAFLARGHDVISCDLLPADVTNHGSRSIDTQNLSHIQGDVFTTLDMLRRRGWWPDLAIFHPTCTFLTCSAEWAYKDPDYDRYPGVGYHQKLKPGTLVGAERRAARDEAVEQFKRLMGLPIDHIAAENPIGALSSRYRPPDQIIQPNWFGDDASKATGLHLKRLPRLAPTKRIEGRLIEWPRGSGKMVRRWANQTDSGQNCVTPSDNRWKDRSKTYDGIGAAFAEQWGGTAVQSQIEMFGEAA